MNFLLFVLPFFFIPFPILQFEIPKVIIAEIVIELIFVVFIFRKNKFNLNKMLIVMLSPIFFITIIDLIFLNSPVSFFGNSYRLQGILLLWHLLLFAILSSIQKVSIPKSKWLLALILGELILGLLLGVTADKRIVGTIGEPNALAAYIVFVYSFILFSKEKQNKLKVTGFIISLILVFLTGSRSGILALMIEIISFFAIPKIGVKKVTVLALIATLLTLSLPFIEGKRSQFENRKEIWRVSLIAIQEKPLLSYGIGNAQNAISHEAQKVNSAIQYATIDSAHNIFLDWYIETGILGLISITALIFLTIKNYVTKNDTTKLFAFLALLTSLLFNPPSIVNLIAFWWLIGASFNRL